MNILVFEDSGVRNLHPITLSRPAYAISCGGYRLIDLLRELDGQVAGWVRPYLERIQDLDFGEQLGPLDPQLKWTLLVNARVAPTIKNLRQLKQLASVPLETAGTNQEPIQVVRSSWAVAAAVVPTADVLNVETRDWRQWIDGLPNREGARHREGDLRLLEYPHCVISANLDHFQENLQHRLQLNEYTQSQSGVYLGRDVQISQPVVFDSSRGPVVIDDEVQIGPFSFFRGPVYIGPKTRISEHASIKDGVSVGHTCKIGGEVEGTIMEPYTNKQHHGFLGHSYLGSWINLGAGTCNSDLKNTYGTVNMEYHGQKVSTGLQFIGCIMGDYAKTAINTSIFTGKTIGVASMVYGFATTNVASFVNYARTFNEYGSLPPDVIVTTQKRMFARRNVEQRPCDIQLIHDMHEITAAERPQGLSGEPLAL